MPDPHAALRHGPDRRIADVGCGAGWSTIALAQAYPDAHVVSYDLDEASIRDAHRHAGEADVDVRFECVDAAALAADGPFDLITRLEALHDMSRPDEVLVSLSRRPRADGSLLFADERVAAEFTAPGDDIERMMYGWSISHCLPVGMVGDQARPIGTAIRPSKVGRLAREAGFESCEVLDIPDLLSRIYRLRAD